MEKSWNFSLKAKSRGKVIAFDKQIPHSEKSALLCGSFSKPKCHVC